jgi:CRISPR/Cas system CMR-associated protein Cmr5 small subunit
MKISIEDQVAALQEAVNKHRSYVATVKRLVAANERPREILEDTERRLPLMEAALKTLQWVQKNRELIIQVHAKSS